MSFTEDELEAFNSILEQRFSTHRQEMVLIFEQSIATLQQDLQQQITLASANAIDSLKQWWAEIGKMELNAQLDTNQERFVQTIEQKEQQAEEAIDQMLAAQLLGIEQLLNERGSVQAGEYNELNLGESPQLEAIEVQADLAWEDLAVVVGKGLDERLLALGESFQDSIKNLEQYLAIHIHSIHDEIARYTVQGQSYKSSSIGASSIQEILVGIEQLGRIVESMQVAMTANHALLSNRLYHHQQLPLERAHSDSSRSTIIPGGSGSLDRMIHKEDERAGDEQ